jgi:hypothetical protein
MLVPEAKDFELLEQGTQVATCFAFIDLGTQDGQYGPKRTVRVMWEIDGKLREDGKPFIVSALFNFSVSDKSKLKPFIEAMMGRKLTREETKGSASERFDTRNLIGRPCLIQAVHDVDGDKTFVNVESAMPLPASIPAPASVSSEKVYFVLDPAEFDEAVFKNLPEWAQNKIGLSPEWMNLVANKQHRGKVAGPVGQKAAAPSADWRDEIPF